MHISECGVPPLLNQNTIAYEEGGLINKYLSKHKHYSV
jgi:hypothetical protein